MSFAIDTNILVYASDKRSPFRATASRVLEEATAGTDLLSFLEVRNPFQ